MSSYHDRWYTRLFSDPRLVEDLLRSFVHESFVDELDFSSLKKLNTKFVPHSQRTRHADMVYEIKSRGQTAYIYLFLEFQSTVDRFMALRMGRYLLEFYQEIQKIKKEKLLNPPFPILIYNGDEKWTAPESLSELFYPSAIPGKYLPEFNYFKIAVNEIPKRELVKIRNAVSAIFYVENSSPEDLARHRKELITLLSSVLREEGGDIVRAIADRIRKMHNIEEQPAVIETVEDLLEESSMWETRVKKYEEKIMKKGLEEGLQKGLQKGLEKGMEKGLEKGLEKTAVKLIEKGMGNDFIHDVTGLSLEQIESLRQKCT